jgi:hypothetical protein
MKTHTTTRIIAVAICFLTVEPLWAVHESGHNLSDTEWLIIKDRVELLDELNFMPTLLPTILRNRDVLQLTDQQIHSFRAWRKQNYVNMVDMMNTIIEQRIEFKKAALRPATSAEDLRQRQHDILQLQTRLLDIKLDCRKILVDSFTDEQWDNFAFIAAEHPRLASFLQ